MMHRILVVEDNEDFRLLLCEMLDLLGHEVFNAASAEQALPMLQEKTFDILLTDLTLPGMSGIECANIAMQYHPAIRIILASGYGFPAQQDMIPGATVLPKPYDFEQLKKAIEGTE